LGVGINMPSGTTRIVTCPADHTLIVKSAYLWNMNSAPVQGNILVTAFGIGSVYLTVRNVPGNGTYEWQGWLVLEPQDQLNVVTDNTGMNIWLSGSVLTGIPIDTPPGRFAQLPQADPLPAPIPEEKRVPLSEVY
jgi:hypothetical protein